MLHDSIWESKQFCLLTPSARLLYIGLITLGDDDGRLKGDPALLRSKIFPRDPAIKVEEVLEWLEEIVACGLIVRYSMSGDDYLVHPNWFKYQTLRADRKKESNIPTPPSDLLPTNGQPDDNQTSAQDKIREGKVRKEKVQALFEEFWKEYPNKTAKKKAKESFERAFRDTPEVEDLFKCVMTGLAKAKKSSQWVKDEGRFIPHPTTWLNQERWNDEGSTGTVQRKTHKI